MHKTPNHFYLICEGGENNTFFVWAFDDENLGSLVLVIGFWLPLPLQASSSQADDLAHGW
jgi:hypothetical protein